MPCSAWVFFHRELTGFFFHLSETRTNFAALHLRGVWFFFLWWCFWYLNSLAEFQHELIQVSHSGPLILSAKISIAACRVLPLFSDSRSDLKPRAFLTSSSTTFFAGSLSSVARGITSCAVIGSTVLGKDSGCSRLQRQLPGVTGRTAGTAVSLCAVRAQVLPRFFLNTKWAREETPGVLSEKIIKQ